MSATSIIQWVKVGNMLSKKPLNVEKLGQWGRGKQGWAFYLGEVASGKGEERGRGDEYQVKQLMCWGLFSTPVKQPCSWSVEFGTGEETCCCHNHTCVWHLHGWETWCLFLGFVEGTPRGQERHSDFLVKNSLLLASCGTWDALDYNMNRASRYGLGAPQDAASVQ